MSELLQKLPRVNADPNSSGAGVSAIRFSAIDDPECEAASHQPLIPDAFAWVRICIKHQTSSGRRIYEIGQLP
jgi:hypothetical protein